MSALYTKLWSRLVFSLMVLCERAGNEYKFAGYSQPEVQYKGNAVKTTARGKRRVKFADGTVIEITYPKYYLRGNTPFVFGNQACCR